MKPLVALFVALAAALPAYGSFGGSPCNRDFGCHFMAWGVVIGVAAGIPLSCVAFGVLHVIFCNPARKKSTQAVVGGFLGIAAYEIAAACGSLVGTMGQDPMVGLLVTWIVLAVWAVLRVRSDPG